ncbi:MAG: alpha/beta fold hydrolase [Caulobacter sp.]
MDRRTPFTSHPGLAGASIEPWLNDAVALQAAIRAGSTGFAEGLDEPLAAYALLRTERLAGAVLTRDGAVLLATPGFEGFLDGDSLDPDALADALGGRRRLVFAEDDDARWTAAAYGSLARAREWTLPAAIAPGLDLPRASVVVLATPRASLDDALADACAAFGLTELQTRVSRALIETGNARDAAARAGVSYETARTVIGEAMRRVGAPKTTAFIERLVRLSFGVWPEGREGADILRDTWGLSPRQAALALRLAEGQTRAEAARASGMSDATAKKELEIIYLALGVRTAAALAARVAGAQALSLLTEATLGEAQTGGAGIEPLRLITRPTGGQVAFSDYGPRGGRPVLVLHSSSASRPAPTILVETLQAAGYRPLALDRPGFGLTDPMPDPDWRENAFASAVDDIVLMLEALKLPRVDVIARGGAQVAVELHHRRPDLMGRVVLVNPDPPTVPEASRQGVLAAVKEAFFRHPQMIEGLARLFAAHLTPEAARRVLVRTLDNSPRDLAVMEEPRNYADYQRGFRTFSTGRVAGYVAEQIGLIRWTTPPLQGAGHWRVLLGAHDPLHDPATTLAYWRSVLPGARFDMIEDAARFIVFSHPGLVVEALATP